MPMTADEAIRILRSDCALDEYRDADSAITAAFAIAARAREELTRAKRVQEESAGLRFARVEMRINMLKRILGEEGSA